MAASETAAISVQNGAPPTVRAAIHAASGGSTASFAYLVQTAAIESGFDSQARAQTSSATGMYQFVEGTWLEMVERHGGEIGLGRYADALNAGDVDPDLERVILDLRRDPKVAAFMAGAYAEQNRRYLEAGLGRGVDDVDQYLAHFLGPRGATTFLEALARAPETPAADLLPAAAQANRGVFYDTARPRTVGEVHALFARKFGQSGDIAGTAHEANPTADLADRSKQIVRPAIRADSPTFAASSAFMVHVLLATLEEADRQPLERRAGSRVSPGNDPGDPTGEDWTDARAA